MSGVDPWVLGIDFGTSYTVAAARGGRGATVLEIGGERRMPSVVLIEEDGSVIVGRPAEDLATAQPGRALRSPKTRLAEATPVVLGGRAHQVTDLVAALLAAVYAEAVRQQGGEPDEVRLTHPASWNRSRLDRLMAAATAAGLPRPRLVPEPVAAAMSFAEEAGVADGSHVLVYDLGGGTFDTAVLQAQGGGFVVVGHPAGEDRLGGNLFDELLANHLGERLEPSVWEALQVSDDPAWQRSATALRSEARRVKEALSSHPYAEALLSLPNGMVTERVTREQFEQLVQSHIAGSVELLVRVVGDAGLQPERLAAVYLAGGASRSPLVERLVGAAFPGVPVSRRGDPKTAVAVGATHPAAAGPPPHGAATGQAPVSGATAVAGAEPPAPSPAPSSPGSGGPGPAIAPTIAPVLRPEPPAQEGTGPAAASPGTASPDAASPPATVTAASLQPPGPGGPAGSPAGGHGVPDPAAGVSTGGFGAAATPPAAPQDQTGQYAPTGQGTQAAPYAPGQTGQYGQYGQTAQYGQYGQTGQTAPYGAGGPAPGYGSAGPGGTGPQPAFVPPAGRGKAGLIVAAVVGVLVLVGAVVVIAGRNGGDGADTASGAVTIASRPAGSEPSGAGPATTAAGLATGSTATPGTGAGTTASVTSAPRTSSPAGTTATTRAGSPSTQRPAPGPGPTAAQVSDARLGLGDLWPGYLIDTFGPDEPLCGETLRTNWRSRATAAFSNSSTAVFVDTDVRSYADEATAAAELDDVRAVVDNCALTSTTIDGVDYLVVVLADDSFPSYCDDSFVVAEAASPIDATAGVTVARAVGVVRCGRNLVSVGHAVIGREYITADTDEFTFLLEAAVAKLQRLPR